MQKRIIIAVVLVIIMLCGIFIYKNCIVEEVIPEKEVEEIELKRTFVRLYYPKRDSNEIGYEEIMVPTNDLVSNPYSYVVMQLMNVPKNGEFETFLNSNVKILSLSVSNNCVIIDFSKEFEECFTGNYEKLEKILKSLKYSLKSFTEIENIKVLVENKEIPMVTEILNRI